LWTVLDAQREQVFAGQFAATDNGWLWHGQTTLLDNASWLAQRSLGDLVAGPALAKLADLLPKSVQIIDRALWNPTAVSVGRIAFRQFAAGRRDDLWQLTPQYFRRSAAEEKRLQAQFSPNNQ
jgi:tRNA A37 threonylcarbamoyladenosine modification protein TsaB